MGQVPGITGAIPRCSGIVVTAGGMAGKAGAATGLIIADGATRTMGMRAEAMAEATFTATVAVDIMADRHSAAEASSMAERPFTVAEAYAAKAASMAADAGKC